MEKGRIWSLDIGKGFCILGVLVIHIITGRPWVLYLCGTLFQGILFYFFWAAGYFYKPGRGTLGERLKKRVKRLLVPFFKYFLIIGLIGAVYVMIAYKLSFSEVCRSLLSELLGINAVNLISPDLYLKTDIHELFVPYYFIIHVVLASFIYMPFADFAVKSCKNMLIVSVPLCVLTAVLLEIDPYLPFNFQLTPFFAAIMTFGAYCGNHDMIEKFRALGKKNLIILLIDLVLVVTVNVNFGNMSYISYGILGDYGGLSTIPAVVLTLLTAYELTFFGEYLGRFAVVRKTLGFMGMNSDKYMFAHMLFAYFISKIFGLEYARSYYDTDVLTGHALYDRYITFALTIVAVTLFTVLLNRFKENREKKKLSAES